MSSYIKKILPFTIPTITTLPGYANILAILESYEKVKPWIYSHYIKTCVVEITNRTVDDIDSVYYTFFNDFDDRAYFNAWNSNSFFQTKWCPFLEIYDIPYEVLTKSQYPLISFIKDSIDSNHYVFSLVDVSKINEYGSEKTFYHDFFIYGYDYDKKQIYFADFPNNPSSKYGCSKCTYDEYENAFYSYMKNSVWMNLRRVILLNVNDNEYDLNYTYIQNNIQEYLYPQSNTARTFEEYLNSDCFYKEREKKVYLGNQVYQFFAQFFQDEINLGKSHIDHRFYHALCDHKEMMLKRIKYLYERNYISAERFKYYPEYEIIRDNALAVRNLVLKYNLSKNISTLNRIPEILTSMKEHEFEVLNKIFL